jgi:hypothetical protein
VLVYTLPIIHVTRLANVDNRLKLEGYFSNTDHSPEASKDPMLSIKINRYDCHCRTTMEYTTMLRVCLQNVPENFHCVYEHTEANKKK